jgi:hypothetical protein
MSALANKVVIEGFGIVIRRKEVPGFGIGNVAQTNLHVVLRHTNYDNMVGTILFENHSLKMLCVLFAYLTVSIWK